MMGKRAQRHDLRSGVVGGAILMAIGAHLLLREIFNIDLGQYGWPFFIIGPGLLLFAGMVIGGRGAGDLAIPGSIVTTIGLLLFVQNLTGRFETWAYGWSLIVIAVGLGLIIAGSWDGEDKQVREGKEVASVGAFLFIGFGTFFELFVFRGHVLTPYIFPVAMIVGGVALVVWNVLRARRKAEPIADDDTTDLPSQEMWPL